MDEQINQLIDRKLRSCFDAYIEEVFQQFKSKVHSNEFDGLRLLTTKQAREYLNCGKTFLNDLLQRRTDLKIKLTPKMVRVDKLKLDEYLFQNSLIQIAKKITK